MDLGGATIRVMTIDTEGVFGKVDPLTGIINGNWAVESTLRDLQFMSNFKVVLDVKRYVKSSNYFAPVVEDLSGGSADVAAGYFYVTNPRAQLVSPLIPISSDGLYAFFSQPVSGSVRNIYLSTFHWSAIFSFATILLFIGLFLVWALKTFRFEDENGNFNYLDGVLLAIAVASQKPTSNVSIATKNSSLRAIVLWGTVLSLFTYSAFCATLLTKVLLPELPIQNIGDLISYKFTFYATEAAQHIIFSPGNKLKQRTGVANGEESEDSLTNVLSGGHVHIDVKIQSITGFLWFMRQRNPPPEDKELCAKVSVIPYSKSNIFITSAFFVPKNSSLRHIFNRNILRIKNAGLLFRYLKATGPTPLGCPPRETSYQNNLDLKTVLSAFILYGILCTIAIVILGLEMLKYF